MQLVYDWKNNNVYIVNPGVSIKFRGLQNGKETEEVLSFAPEFKRNSSKRVRPGGWFKGVNEFFTFDKKIKEMEIEIADFFRFDDVEPYVLKIKDISKLK